MARYLQTAAQANEVVKDIVNSVKELTSDNVDVGTIENHILSQCLYLYNLGIRTAPRATQSTVRLNAVKEAAKGTNASVTMTEKQGHSTYKGNYTYKAIRIQTGQQGNNIIEEGNDED